MEVTFFGSVSTNLEANGLLGFLFFLRSQLIAMPRVKIEIRGADCQMLSKNLIAVARFAQLSQL